MDKTSGHSKRHGDLSYSPAFGGQAIHTGSIHTDSRSAETRPFRFRIPQSGPHTFSNEAAL